MSCAKLVVQNQVYFRPDGFEELSPAPVGRTRSGVPGAAAVAGEGLLEHRARDRLRDSGGPPEPRTAPGSMTGRDLAKSLWTRAGCGARTGLVAGIRGALFRAEKDARMRHTSLVVPVAGRAPSRSLVEPTYSRFTSHRV